MKNPKSKLRVFCVVLLIAVSTCTSLGSNPAFNFIPDISQVPGMPKNTDAISIEGNTSSGFEGITYQVTSTGATSGTTYRTSAIYVVVEGYIFTVDSTQLMQTVPAGGKSITSQVTINKDQLLAGLNLPNDPELRQRIKDAIKDPSKIGIRADIEILSGGKVVDKIHGGSDPQNRKAEFQRVAKKYGFDKKHTDDWETRFKDIAQPTGIIGPPVTVNPPATTDPTPESTDPPSPGGLRPSVIVR